MNLSSAVPGATDFVPSIFLARVPAGNASELDQFVSKVITYENFQASDTWRGRMMLVSDDEYSTGIFSAAGYCHNPAEALFHDSNVDLRESGLRKPVGAGYPVRLLRP